MTAPFRRRVHYISGFDPRGAVFYHRLYRDEAEKQSRLNGAVLTVSPRKRRGDGVHAWQIAAQWPDGAAATDFRFMSWDDVIRKRWIGGWAPSLLNYLGDITRYVFTGAFMKLARTGRGPLYAAVMPLLIVVPPLAIAALVAALGGWLPGLLAGALAVWAIRELARRFNLTWLHNIYGFCCAWGRAPLPDLEARLDQIAAGIARSEREEPVDEVLLVGHSVGALLAISVMARLVAPGTGIRLVTLGACAPMIGLMPGAAHFRASMQALAAAPDLQWRDIASLSDPLSFARVDPLAVCGIARRHPATQTRELIKIVRMFTPEAYAKMKPDKLRLHFQYLMAGELAADYDYFRLTAGPGAQ